VSVGVVAVAIVLGFATVVALVVATIVVIAGVHVIVFMCSCGGRCGCVVCCCCCCGFVR